MQIDKSEDAMARPRTISNTDAVPTRESPKGRRSDRQAGFDNLALGAGV